MRAIRRSLTVSRLAAMIALGMSSAWRVGPLAAQTTPHVTGAGPEKPAIWGEAAAMLEHGAAAWNGGDLDGFLSDYTDDATFVTSRGLVRGSGEIRSRYAARFAPGATRDSLTFRLLDVDALGPRTAAIVATWVLSRGDSVTSTGPTSLVLKKVGRRWRIAHDHSN
jgi:uncharacterized protein (TIGR02246 family)